MAKPDENVPENLLPAVKALFLYYSQGNYEEFSELLNNRINSAIIRRDPSLMDFMASMDEFVNECNNNPDKKFLLFQVFAGHGYHTAGFEEVLG